MCEKVYEEGQSEEEAMAEMRENFGTSYTKEDCENVCNDCYNEMFPYFKQIQQIIDLENGKN